MVCLEVLKNNPIQWKGYFESGMILMPEGFKIYNSREPCTIASGPCNCSSWHSRADWLWRLERNMKKPEEFEVIKKLIQIVDREEEGKWKK